MKTLQFNLIIFLMLNLSPVLAQWQIISSGTTANLVDGCFVSDSVGFVISSGGKVLKTTNQGATWHQSASLTGVFTSICSSGPDTIFAGGNCIYRSTNGGSTWNQIAIFTSTISDLVFFRGGAGFKIVPGYTTCNWGGTIRYISNYIVDKSDDGGITWAYAFSPGDPGKRFEVVNERAAFITGGYYDILAHCSGPWYDYSKKTANKGANWYYFTQPRPGGSLISFISESTGYYVRDSETIYKTIDAGSTITAHYTEKPNSVFQVFFVNEIDGYLLSSNKIYATKSSGFAWKEDFITADTLNYLFKNMSSMIFALGNHGQILRKTHVASTYPDTIYRVKLSMNPVKFGFIPVDSLAVKPLTVKNTGSLPLDLTIAGKDPYQISFINGSFADSLHLTLIPFQDSVVFIRFKPPSGQGMYSDTLRITAAGLEPVMVPLTGAAYNCLVNNITKDTLICTDTLRIGANIAVMETAKLSICAGTRVIFMSDFQIKVKGILEALGDSNHPIVVDSFDPTLPWKGFCFENMRNQDTSVLRYCNITANCNSSSVLINDGAVIIDHCTISNGYEAGEIRGNGITMVRKTIWEPALLISNSKICNNKGTGILCDHCERTIIQNNEIYGNTTGIMSETFNLIKIRNNLIYNNKQEGIAGFGDVLIRKNKVFSNGGGITMICYTDTIENNEIFNNAYLGGINLQLFEGNTYIVQNLIYNNSSTLLNGAGINLQLLHFYDQPAFLASNTICNNQGMPGGKGDNFYATALSVPGREIQLSNNIFFNISQKNNIYWTPETPHTIDFNCIHQDGADSLGQNTITADPAMVFPTDSSGVMKNLGSYSWALLSNSPCINAGNMDVVSILPEFDFAGNPRITQNRVDVGVYEYPYPFNLNKKQAAVPEAVYPNPADDILHVKVNTKQPAGIVIYDLTSRMVIQANFMGQISLNTSQLAPGIYLYQLKVKDGINIKGKFVKQ
ncbi:MAG: right-handed parallel beta-helix repeat-containing protein [Bacteroidales bacterium]